MIPLSKLHLHLAVPLWYLAIFAFFISSVFLIKKILISDKQQRSLSKVFYFLGILMSLRFLLSVVQRVQSDALGLFLLSVFIYALYRQKEVLAGICLASASMIKLTPLIFVPYLLLRKRMKASAAFGLAMVFYLLAPALYLGANRNFQYLKDWLWVLRKKTPPEYILWYKNQSLWSCLSRFLTKGSQVSIANLDLKQVFVIFAFLAVLFFCLTFIVCRKLNLGSKTQVRAKYLNPGFFYLIEISLVLICMVLLSPLAWKHTFVHLIIPHLVLIYYLLYINRADKITFGLLIGSFFLNTVLNPELTKLFAQLIQEYSNITFGTLLLFAALLRIRSKFLNR